VHGRLACGHAGRRFADGESREVGAAAARCTRTGVAAVVTDGLKQKSNLNSRLRDLELDKLLVIGHGHGQLQCQGTSAHRYRVPTGQTLAELKARKMYAMAQELLSPHSRTWSTRTCEQAPVHCISVGSTVLLRRHCLFGCDRVGARARDGLRVKVELLTPTDGRHIHTFQLQRRRR
jgi:hypothetical protein